MRTEGCDGRLMLVGEEGVEVVRGDPLCVGGLTCFFGWLEEFGERPPGKHLSVALLEWPDATGWERCVSPDDDKLWWRPTPPGFTHEGL